MTKASEAEISLMFDHGLTMNKKYMLIVRDTVMGDDSQIYQIARKTPSLRSGI